LWPNGAVQATWNSPVTSRLLLEAGASAVFFHWPGYLLPGVSPDAMPILEQSQAFRYNSPGPGTTGVGGTLTPDRRTGDRYSQRFAVSYITGSHAFKVGVQQNEGYSDTITEGLGLPEAKGVGFTFLRGVPISLTQRTTPYRVRYFQKAEFGAYAQDQWTLKRLTFNYGLRFDYYNGYVPAIHLEAGPFVPARDFPAVYKAPEWKDWNPRVGVAYDLFGNAQTALRVSLGRYVAMTGNNQVMQYVPVNTAVNSADRSWTDTNGNFFPDCDLKNFATNGECGGINNANFGKNDPNATRFADDVRYGWGIRPDTWDFGTEVQHQLRSNLSVTAGYYRNWDGNLAVTDNVAVTPADYSTYCITAPKDPRLPGGGGYQVCGLADINPNKFNQVSNVITQASNFGKYTRRNDFFALNVDTRLGSGIRLGGGLDTGRTVDDVCFDVDTPGAVAANLPSVVLTGNNSVIPFTSTTIDGQRLCRVVTPFAATTQIKMNGSYPLPRDFVVSATLQNLAGLSYLATYPATTAEIAPSLGRQLSGGVRSANVPIVMPQSVREPRRTQIDFRLTKLLNLGRKRVQANFDIYNLLNDSAVLGENNTFGGSWRKPTLVLGGRLIQFSGNVNF
jgi:hypothetical protein